MQQNLVQKEHKIDWTATAIYENVAGSCDFTMKISGLGANH